MNINVITPGRCLEHDEEQFIVALVTEDGAAIVPTLAVPVLPLLEGSTRPYSMFTDYWKYDWVLEVHRYQDLTELISSLDENVIAPGETKVQQLEKRRGQARR
jgi:hypothetical protein